MRTARRRHGWTLIELLVALAIMALLAAMSWRGIDAMLTVREGVERNTQALLGWQTALAQWQADLDAWSAAASQGDDTGEPHWSASAQTVRLLRRAAEGSPLGPGWHVVAWAATDGGTRWSRWQSPLLRDRAQLDLFWTTAPQRVRDEGVRTVAITDWRVQIWSQGAWQPVVDDAPPAAIRLTLTPAPEAPFSGALNVDWVAPWVAGGKR